MNNRKTRKVVVYVMIFAMLASTLLTGIAFLL
ncbi:stressosome-associated protein Prli42 [Cytobacillus spongiae]|nr:stressosome-associated protein Prli42 [Cytobacillus spongiae]UII54760.1 stressosome-associated protein Prli42 [Cytobacillus spongiae]